MASYNKVMLMGNLTRDPEVRYTPKGSAVCDIGLAVNRVYSSESGEKIEEVTFVDVVLWGKTAELAGKYLHTGRPGGGGGYNRSAARPAQRPAPAQQRPAQRPAPAQQNDDFGEGPITDGMEDDDIPF